MKKNNGYYFDLNRKSVKTELDDFNAEARKLGLSYGELQARETCHILRSNKTVKKLKELENVF